MQLGGGGATVNLSRFRHPQVANSFEHAAIDDVDEWEKPSRPSNIRVQDISSRFEVRVPNISPLAYTAYFSTTIHHTHAGQTDTHKLHIWLALSVE